MEADVTIQSETFKNRVHVIDNLGPDSSHWAVVLSLRLCSLPCSTKRREGLSIGLRFTWPQQDYHRWTHTSTSHWRCFRQAFWLITYYHSGHCLFILPGAFAPILTWEDGVRDTWWPFPIQVLVMGLKNATSVFQRTLRHVLRDLIGNGVKSFIDDLIIHTKTP